MHLIMANMSRRGSAELDFWYTRSPILTITFTSKLQSSMWKSINYISGLTYHIWNQNITCTAQVIIGIHMYLNAALNYGEDVHKGLVELNFVCFWATSFPLFLEQPQTSSQVVWGRHLALGLVLVHASWKLRVWAVDMAFP